MLSFPFEFLNYASPLLLAGDQFKGSLDVLNKYSESPIHIAIRLSQEKVLQLLLDKGANSRMLCGHMYAIHLALKNNCRGCVQVLIKHNKECVHDKDEKYQGHPLHWTKTSQVYVLYGSSFKDLNLILVNRLMLSITINEF